MTEELGKGKGKLEGRRALWMMEETRKEVMKIERRGTSYCGEENMKKFESGEGRLID